MSGAPTLVINSPRFFFVFLGVFFRVESYYYNSFIFLHFQIKSYNNNFRHGKKTGRIYNSAMLQGQTD